MSAARCRWLAALAVLLVASSAYAVLPVSNYRLVVGDPLKTSDGVSQRRAVKLAEMTQERIKARLRAAEVKSHEVVLNKDGTLRVMIHRNFPAGWYAALMLSPGKFAIQPRTRGGINWVMLATEIPQGVEIRSDKADETKTYLWAAKRDTLSQTMKRFHFKNFSAVLGPDDIDGGWRTYTVGKSVLTQENVKEASRQMSSTGVTFVRLQLTSDTPDRLAAATTSDVQQWVVVLDGEVLGLVQSAVLNTGKLQLSAPTRATSRDEQRSWALQVVGRLAAPLPIKVAIVQE